MATNGNLPIPVISMEDKLLLLEKRFAELEGKYLNLHADMLKEKNVETNETKTEEKSEEPKTGHEKSPKAEDKATLKARVRVVTSRIDTETKERKDFDSEQILDSTTKHDYALLLRKNLEEENEENDGDIEIYDDGLLKLLRKLLRHYPGHLFEGKPVTIPSPYEPLVQNWDLLLEESKKESDEEDRARSDLGELLNTILKGSGDAKLDSYMQVRDSLKKQGSINFEALWTIFPPGTVVYGHLFLKRDQVFIVEDNLRTWPREENNSRSEIPNIWELRCWTYDFTGKKFLRKAVRLPFEQFQGTKPISSLPFYPLDAMSADKRKEAEDRLMRSGEMFRKYCTVEEGDRMYKYTGQALLDKKGLRDIKTKDPSNDLNRSLGILLLGRERAGLAPPKAASPSYSFKSVDTMVDFDSYYLHGSARSQIGDTAVEDDITDCQCPECSKNEMLAQIFKPHYDNSTGDKSEKWEKLQTMMCPPRVLGYILQDKQWAQLAVDNLEDIPDEDLSAVMNSLHLDGEDDGQKEKDLLYWLVKNHGIGKAGRSNKGYELDDIVAEKGKGLVILLYGTPGVGKTSTAQMIAKAARKPLFPISVADVGTDAEFVESNFRRIFDLATTWKAILLIDEADVFLQSRTQGTFGPSAERSALVSVFLRVLEYYRGILFLTTNQIAQFDIAVQSRVHIALKYNDLSKKQTKDIFVDFLSQYKNKGMVEGSEALERYAEKELPRKKFDGRQIRNIVSCAMGYARGQDQKMSLEHVQHIVGYVEEFKDDLAGQRMKWQELQNGTRMS